MPTVSKIGNLAKVYRESNFEIGEKGGTVGDSILENLSNKDGNVNENVAKQWIKLQNTITARGNATTWPLFRRRL